MLGKMSKTHAKILILGRPNVGKSSFINRMIKTRRAIVSEIPGVTRDVREFEVDWNGTSFMLLDSGGLFLDKHPDYMQEKIEAQVKTVLKQVQTVLFLVEYPGVHALDQRIATWLRPLRKKVLLVVNKVDRFEDKGDIHHFRKLGFGTPFPISVLQGQGLGDLLDKIVLDVKDFSPSSEVQKRISVAIVGRPNVGKSSLMNALVRRDAAIVHNEAGTTRDTVEVSTEIDGVQYTLVDTAGLRRRRRIQDDIEYYSVLRSDRAIEFADLVMMVLDAEQLVSDQDKKIIQFILDNRRHMMLFINKWDLMPERGDVVQKDVRRILEAAMPSLAYYPVLFGSATEKKGLQRLFPKIAQIVDTGSKRVSTGQFNKFVSSFIDSHPPAAKRGKRLKVYYATQAEVSPATFVFFVNEPSLITDQYRRFIEKNLRQLFGGLEGCALRLKFKPKSHVKNV